MPHGNMLIQLTDGSIAAVPRIDQPDPLVRAHDDLRACERELAETRRALARAQAKLARHAAVRTSEALAARVVRAARNMWHVPSDTADGGYRVVVYSERTEGYSCDCPGFVNRGTCRHEQAASLANRPQGAATDRAGVVGKRVGKS